MHQRTRRQLCRLVFVAVCVVPTFFSLSWAAYRASPLHAANERSAWEKTLFELTGLLAVVNRVDHPPGGSTLLVGVQLIDPDGGDRVASLRQAEIARTQQGTVVLLSQPDIAKGKFLRLCDTLHDRVLRGPLPKTAVQITSGEVTLEVGPRAQTFTRVRCTVEPYEGGVRTFVEFQLAGSETAAAAQLQIERNRQITPPSTRWHLQSDAPIPCDLFGDYVPVVASLGPRCRFHGSIVVAMTRNDWSGEISGRFSQLDLGLATESFPHRLSGLADVTVRQAIVAQGTLQEASGNIVSAGGSISPSLLISLAEQLHANIPARLAELPQPYIPYREMRFDFAISSAGMTVAGRCTGESPGVIFKAAGGELLAANPAHTYPIVAVVRALSPASDWLVPATDESKRLLGVLAFPSVRRPASLAKQPARVRLE